MIDGNKDHCFLEVARRRPTRVLELGPCHGRDTVALSGLCQEVVTIEGRKENFDSVRCRLDDFRIKNARLIFDNLETFDLTTLGRFDLVWAVGVIYHVPKPWELIASIQRVTDCCVGWTHLSAYATESRCGYSGSPYAEGQDILSGLSSESFWLSPDDFLRSWSGWSAMFLTPPAPHENGGLVAQFVTEIR